MVALAQMGLRAKMSAIVAVVVVLVMLPFVLAGVAYLDRQGRAEAERQLSAAFAENAGRGPEAQAVGEQVGHSPYRGQYQPPQ